jgi:hypothetical protein
MKKIMPLFAFIAFLVLPYGCNDNRQSQEDVGAETYEEEEMEESMPLKSYDSPEKGGNAGNR